MGLGPKAMLSLGGRPLVAWVVDKAARVAGEVVVAVPASAVPQVQALCPGARVVAGGASRQDTVERLMEACRGQWLMIHDAARPFASQKLMEAVAQGARETGVAGAFLQPDVPVAVLEGGYVQRDYKPSQVGVFQAPQAYSKALLKDLYLASRQQGWQEQSTLQLALRQGLRVRAVPGEKTNIKLTMPEDWAFAQGLVGYLR